MSQTVTSAELHQIEQQSHARQFGYAISISRWVALGGLGYTALQLVLWRVFPSYPQLAFASLAGLPLSLCAALCAPLHRAGKSQLGVTLLLIGIFSVALLVPPFLPEILPATPIGYVAITIIAYISLDKKIGHWFAGLSTLGYLADVLLTKLWSPNVFQPLLAQVGVPSGAALATFAMAVVAVIIYRLIAEQNTGYYQSQVANLEVAKRAQAEQRARQELQSAVDQYAAYMRQVGQGQLATRLTLEATDGENPLAVLGRHLNETVASLQQMTLQLRDTASSLVSSSAEILAATSQQAGGTSEQLTALAQTSTTIEEVRAMAEQTTRHALGVVEIAQRTAQVSATGQQAVADAVQGMVRVKGHVEAITGHITALAAQTQTIGKIIATVREIAAQSNMLALNAAVEAARAGEAGKGFAVVAKEVRNLAEQSRVATEEVHQLLSEIQEGVRAAVAATEEGLQGTEAGMELARDAGSAIEQLAASVDESALAAAKIDIAAGQQLAGMNQITTAIQNIQEVTAQAVASTQQTERSAQYLNQMAGHLREMVERYEL